MMTKWKATRSKKKIYFLRKKPHSSSAICKKNILIHAVCAQKVRQFAQGSLRVKEKKREGDIQKKIYTEKKERREQANAQDHKENVFDSSTRRQSSRYSTLFDLFCIHLDLSSADIREIED
jgi:hypothetical protein